MNDNVNHPKHYTSHPSGIECIQITRHYDFCIGNAIKYLYRHKYKNNPLEDLKKCIFYINEEIKFFETEIWQVFPKDNRYEISTQGNVRLIGSSTNRKLVIIKNGYATFVVLKDGKHKLYYVHRSVIETFVGNIPKDMDVCHTNGDRTNNALYNLRIDSRSKNHLDKNIHGTSNNGIRNGGHKLNLKDVELIRQNKNNLSNQSLSDKFGVSKSQIERIRYNKNWKPVELPELIININRYLSVNENDYLCNVAFKLISMSKWSSTKIEDLKNAIRHIEEYISHFEN